MAFTSGLPAAGAGAQTHAVEIQASGDVRNIRLYDRPGDDMLEHKGDLWKINMTNFHFNDQCITISEITRVSIIEHSFDGWNIDSIVTFVKDASGGIQVLTQNLDVNRWIDGNNHHSHRRFELTNA